MYLQDQIEMLIERVHELEEEVQQRKRQLD